MPQSLPKGPTSNSITWMGFHHMNPRRRTPADSSILLFILELRNPKSPFVCERENAGGGGGLRSQSTS